MSLRESTVRTLRLLLSLLAFSLAAGGALLTLRLDNPILGITLLRGAGALLIVAIIMSLIFRPGQRLRRFDPRAGRDRGED